MKHRSTLFVLTIFSATCAQALDVGDPKTSSATGEGAGGTSSTGGASSPTGTGGKNGAGGMGGMGGGNLNLGGTGGGVDDCATTCCLTCSTDLEKVIDCNGEVVTTCANDQACAAGTCITDTCLAAETSKSSYGCDYWPLEPDLVGIAAGGCFAAFIANTWTVPVHIEVDYDGQSLPVGNFARIPQGQGPSITYAPYDAAAGLAPGEVAILFLSRETGGNLIDCPAPAAVTFDASVHGTGRGKAFHVTTDRPVIAYQILPYGGGDSLATSATLLLPTSAWDTNYVAANAYQQGAIDILNPSLAILAYQDNTTVTILPKTAIEGNTNVAASPANTPVTYTLAKGEYVQFTQAEELTGSPIQANNPIAVIGGSTCMSIPVDGYACDGAHQQLPPIKALGSEYVALRYRGRNGGTNESVPWRLVGAVDGTQLTWTPAPPAGAPTTIDRGTVAEFDDTGPFIVKSQDAQHPFYVAAYMTSADEVVPGVGEGDPEWVNVIPPAQYLDSYVFFTDPTYSETSLNVIRRPDKNGQFADVTLDCAGVLGNWTPLGPYEWTRVDLVTGNFESVNGCSNGRHEMKSDLPFGLTVWGWGSLASTSLNTTYVSYAYPAGAGFQPINGVVVPPVPK
jgi:hypothetical protein